MEAISSLKIRDFGVKGIAVASTSCVISLTIMILAFGLNPSSEREPKNLPAKESDKNSGVGWNPALGNVVVVSPELGLSVKTLDESKIEAARITARIETQLMPLRIIYRDESEKSPGLMGGLLLQLTLGASGEVVKVTELDSHIADEDFRKAVIAEAGKWVFKDVAPEGTVIDCPLLFVREGMDIKTVVKWEKTLGLFEKRTADIDAKNRSGQESKSPSDKGSDSDDSGKKPGKKRNAELFENRPARTPLQI